MRSPRLELRLTSGVSFHPVPCTVIQRRVDCDGQSQVVIVDGNQEAFLPVPCTDPLTITGGELRAGLLYDGRTQLCHLPSPVTLTTARELVHNFTAHLRQPLLTRRVAGPVPMPTCPLRRAKGASCDDGFADRWSRWRTGMFPATLLGGEIAAQAH